MKKVYIITRNYDDLEQHKNEIASNFAYRSREKALEKALELCNDSSFFKYDVIEMMIEEEGGDK